MIFWKIEVQRSHLYPKIFELKNIFFVNFTCVHACECEFLLDGPFNFMLSGTKNQIKQLLWFSESWTLNLFLSVEWEGFYFLLWFRRSDFWWRDDRGAARRKYVAIAPEESFFDRFWRKLVKMLKTIKHLSKTWGFLDKNARTQFWRFQEFDP